MKINGSGGLFHSYCAPGFVQKKADGLSSLSEHPKGDRVMLSKEVLALIQMQNRIRAIEQARENANNAPEVQVLDSMRKAMKVQKICNQIAARIRAGDHVPLKDLRYLKKNDPQAYQMAMVSRKPNDDPKMWKSAVPKENQEPSDEHSTGNAEGDTVDTQTLTSSECSSGTSCSMSSSGGTGSGTSSGAI